MKKNVAPEENIEPKSDIDVLYEKVFVYASSEADERYFRQRIVNYLRGRDKKSLTNTMFDATYIRNNNGATAKYLYFSESSQRLYLEDNFYMWAKLACEELSKLVPIAYRNDIVKKTA